jgi:hypothetical protein
MNTKIEEKYKKQLKNYHDELDSANHYGPRSQELIDSAYATLCKLHGQLSEEEQKSQPLPECHQLTKEEEYVDQLKSYYGTLESKNRYGQRSQQSINSEYAILCKLHDQNHVVYPLPECFQVPKEEQYQFQLNEYYRVLEFTSGCGERGQGYIDSAYAFLKELHGQLSVEKQEENPLPSYANCEDDGTYGMASGMALYAANVRRSF